MMAMEDAAAADYGMDLLTILRGGNSDEEEIGEGQERLRDDRLPQQQENHHHLSSIQKTVVIRQLRSQGLSFQIWPAASSLVSLLNQDPSALLAALLPPNSHQPPLRVLELGSGTGLVGIAAASILGAHVTITDLPHVLPNLHFNSQSNAAAISAKGGTVEVVQLRWGHHEEDLVGEKNAGFDLILASDVVYHDHLFDPLLQTLQFFLRGGEVVFLMAHLKRWKKRDSVFFRKARKMFDIAVIHRDPPPPGSRIGVAVYGFVEKARRNNDGSSTTLTLS